MVRGELELKVDLIVGLQRLGFKTMNELATTLERHECRHKRTLSGRDFDGNGKLGDIVDLSKSTAQRFEHLGRPM